MNILIEKVEVREAREEEVEGLKEKLIDLEN